MTAQPAASLDYANAHDALPRWVTRLAVASLMASGLLLVMNIARMSDARMYVFDTTFHWLYPPPAWIPPAYLASVVACIAVAVFLLVIGVTSLVIPRVSASLHQIYVAAQVVVAFASSWLRALLMLRHPDVSAFSMIFEAMVGGLALSLYALIVQMVLTRNRQRS